jgi:hypothetical protein
VIYSGCGVFFKTIKILLLFQKQVENTIKEEKL